MEIDDIKSIFKNQNDIMKTEELYKNGMTKYVLSKLIKSNVLERVTKGYYKLATEEISDIKLISILLPPVYLSIFILPVNLLIFFFGPYIHMPR